MMNRKLFLISNLIFLASVAMAAPSKQPVIELRADPIYFSPNGDKLQDQTFFYPVMRTNGKKDSDVTRWRMWIRKPSGKKIQKLNGPGLPALIKWDGLTKKEKLAKEGEYQSHLTIWGKGFKIKSAAVPIFVDNTPPQVTLTVPNPKFEMTSEGFDTLEFQTGIADESPISQWQLQIMDVQGRIVQVFSSSEPTTTVKWDGKDRQTGVLVPKGDYRCAFMAWDAAGNESETAFVDISVEISTQEMLEQVLENITVFETDLGLIVQLPSSEMFDIEKGKPELKVDDDVFLKEAAILINAYPDVPVQIDGYSSRLKNSSQDRDRGSRYGWRVYSHLVKKGNVKASRLQVRGRGRSAMFDRREVDDPPDLVVLKNGVEVILLGNRDWSE